MQGMDENMLFNRAVGCRRSVGIPKLLNRAVEERERLLKIICLVYFYGRRSEPCNDRPPEEREAPLIPACGLDAD